jgi:hypothetical protein
MGIKSVLCTLSALVMLGSCALMGLEEEDTTTTDTGGSTATTDTGGSTTESSQSVKVTIKKIYFK